MFASIRSPSQKRLIFGLILALIVMAVYLPALFAFGTATFWFFLLPASNFIPMFRPMADRFLYFPMIGVALMLASLLIKLPKQGLVTAVLVCAAIIPLAAHTLSQERIRHGSTSLWKATLQTNPASLTAFSQAFAWIPIMPLPTFWCRD
jgi:uncharacterized membrane protein YraQ (UPF0718 family)